VRLWNAATGEHFNCENFVAAMTKFWRPTKCLLIKRLVQFADSVSDSDFDFESESEYAKCF